VFYDELKGVSIAAMEEAIATAISALAGANFTCTISNIDLSSIHGARIDIFLAPPNDFESDSALEAIA
jgi:hypothetical protein